MNIRRIEGLSADQIMSEVQRGGLRRHSDAYFIRAGENASSVGMRYTLISLFFGWWGFPWGLIRTPQAIATNSQGGIDVTPAAMQSLRLAMPARVQS